MRFCRLVLAGLLSSSFALSSTAATELGCETNVARFHVLVEGFDTAIELQEGITEEQASEALSDAASALTKAQNRVLNTDTDALSYKMTAAGLAESSHRELIKKGSVQTRPKHDKKKKHYKRNLATDGLAVQLRPRPRRPKKPQKRYLATVELEEISHRELVDKTKLKPPGRKKKSRPSRAKPGARRKHHRVIRRYLQTVSLVFRDDTDEYHRHLAEDSLLGDLNDELNEIDHNPIIKKISISSYKPYDSPRTQSLVKLTNAEIDVDFAQVQLAAREQKMDGTPEFQSELDDLRARLACAESKLEEAHEQYQSMIDSVTTDELAELMEDKEKMEQSKLDVEKKNHAIILDALP